MPQLPNERHFSSDHFINRELSLLQFQRRVLAQAADPSVPLLERLRFLCIVSSNLDEFFEVRVAGVKEQQLLGSQVLTTDGLTPAALQGRISREVHGIITEQYNLLNNTILPALSERYPGTFAERVAVPKRNLVPKPASLSFEQAACLPTAWLTAYRMLTTRSGIAPGNALPPGSTVLVQGAGGGGCHCFGCSRLRNGPAHGEREKAEIGASVGKGKITPFPPILFRRPR